MNISLIKWRKRVLTLLSLIRQVLVLPDAAKIREGSVNQEDQSFVDDEQLEAGLNKTCVAYPTSDDTIQLGAEDEL